MELSPEILSYEVHYGIVSRRPNILLIGMGIPYPAFTIFADGSFSVEVLCGIAGPGGHLLISPWWNLIETPSWQRQLARIAETARALPQTRITFLCNAPQEVPTVQAHGLDAVFINQNAFVQENLFNIAPEPKIYRAIYNAQLLRLKRHELAAKVAGLALIYSPWNTETYATLRSQLSEAAFLNGEPESDQYRLFDGKTVARYLNSSRVGLCLSAEEGAMFASMEYLLCGLPVVSTPSRGGRDVFFDAEYSAIVPPDPDAVAEAVTALIARSVDPAIVRARTLTKVAEHRKRFVELVDRLQLSAGQEPTGRAELDRLLTSPWQWFNYGSIADIMRDMAG